MLLERESDAAEEPVLNMMRIVSISVILPKTSSMAEKLLYW